MPPLRIGIVGMGGYAGLHHEAVFHLEEKHQARLVCTCDPQAHTFAAQQESWHLAQRGVRLFTDYDKMLEAFSGKLDVVAVPTPIPLHAPMHQAAVARGIPVYLEKPPTLDYAELDEMIARERFAKKMSLVGFNFIIEKSRIAIKRRLLAGEFGALHEVRIKALSARPDTFFQRNAWTGRLLIEGKIVGDSCFGNDLGHLVHNALFWAGENEISSWAKLSSVRAELYRGHAIETADTFFVESRSTSEVKLRFALSQAHSGASTQAEILICEKATVLYSQGQNTEIRWDTGKIERIAMQPFDPLVENHLEYYRYLRGEVDRPATTLDDTRSFVALNNLAFISSGAISPIPVDRLTICRNEKDQKNYLAVAGLEALFDEFLDSGKWPSNHGWPRVWPSAVVTPGDLPRYRQVIQELATK